MKTLEKLKLHNLGEIGVAEQMAIRGGGKWTWMDGSWTYMIDDVTVTAPYQHESRSLSWVQGFSDGWGASDQGGYQNGGNFMGYATSIVNPNIDGQNNGGGGVNYNNRCSISQDGLDFIKSWEKGPNGGVALMPYDDNGSLPGGNMTIGWGHRIKTNENFKYGITAEEANTMLLADLQISINDVNNSVHVTLTQSQFDALVSYSFNTGGLSNSPSCLLKLNIGDYAGAAAEMDIVTQNSITLPGLVTRRANEQTMFNYGFYSNHN